MSEHRIKGSTELAASSRYYSFVPSQVIPLVEGMEESFLPLHKDHRRLEYYSEEEIEERRRQIELGQIKSIPDYATKQPIVEEGAHYMNLEEVEESNNNSCSRAECKNVLKAASVLFGIIIFWIILAHILPQRNPDNS